MKAPHRAKWRMPIEGKLETTMVRIADEMREDNFCRAPRGKDQASVTHQWRNIVQQIISCQRCRGQKWI